MVCNTEMSATSKHKQSIYITYNAQVVTQPLVTVTVESGHIRLFGESVHTK